MLGLALVTTRDPPPPAGQAEPDPEDRHRLTTLSGLAALSLDALSSVAYGPEAIVVVLVAAGTAGLAYTLPVTYAIVILLGVLVISYRQVIAAFPGGGGAYAVASTHLGRMPSLIAAASLIVDYVLNAAVGVSAGVAALTSAFPRSLQRHRADLPDRARPDHRREPVGRGRVGAAVHRADAGLHRRDRGRDRRRPDPQPSRWSPRRRTCRRSPSPSACCCCSAPSPPAARR